MLIIGIDPGISGSICFFEDGKITDLIEMPSMAEGKKNKRQVNGHQIYNELSYRIKEYNIKNINVVVTETRPFIHGARLTTWELVQLGIPVNLIIDSAFAILKLIFFFEISTICGLFFLFKWLIIFK